MNVTTGLDSTLFLIITYAASSSASKTKYENSISGNLSKDLLKEKFTQFFFKVFE
jgi:hypothetical protein